MVKVDLHLHSNVSVDGQYSPAQLMGLCYDAGLTTVSLTDHNSIRGVCDAMHEAENLGLEFICGVELDCVFGDYNLHIVGYGIDISNSKFSEIEDNIMKQFESVVNTQIDLIRRMGFYCETEEIQKRSINGLITDESISVAVFEDPRNADNPLLASYLEGGSFSNNPSTHFYWDFFAKDKPAYAPYDFISLEEAIELINSANGIPVLAHPGVNIKKNEKVMDQIIFRGVKGVEVFSSYHDDDITDFYNYYASKRGILKTGGSDFHGRSKPSVKLGIQADDQDNLIRIPLLSAMGILDT